METIPKGFFFYQDVLSGYPPAKCYFLIEIIRNGGYVNIGPALIYSRKHRNTISAIRSYSFL